MVLCCVYAKDFICGKEPERKHTDLQCDWQELPHHVMLLRWLNVYFLCSILERTSRFKHRILKKKVTRYLHEINNYFFICSIFDLIWTLCIVVFSIFFIIFIFIFLHSCHFSTFKDTPIVLTQECINMTNANFLRQWSFFMVLNYCLTNLFDSLHLLMRILANAMNPGKKYKKNLKL